MKKLKEELSKENYENIITNGPVSWQNDQRRIQISPNIFLT